MCRWTLVALSGRRRDSQLLHEAGDVEVRALIGVDLLRALLLGSIPLAAVLGVLAMSQLYVVAALNGALTLVCGGAYTAYLRGLVSSTRLMEANARLELSRSAAHVGGPGLAGAPGPTLSPRAAPPAGL